MVKKIFQTVLALCLACCVFSFKNIYATEATAVISANKTSVTVGDTVTVTVAINAKSWAVVVSGDTSDRIAGANFDDEFQSTTKTYTIKCEKVGTYNVSISGTIADGEGNTVNKKNVNGSVTITVKAKEQNNTSGGSNNKNNNNNNNSGGQTYVKSSDATLKALKLDIEGLSPSFSRYTYTYTLSVPSNVDSIRVTASTNHSKARYSVRGNTNLKNGDNNIYVTVTAENGTTKTYKIIVTKADNPEKANAYLKNIIIGNATLKSEFSRETMSYELENIENDINSLDISVFPENQNATFEISGNENLKVGLNEIKILVTAEDKTTTKEYVLTVNKLDTKKEENKPDKVEDQNSLAVAENNAFISNKIKTDSETQLLILVYILAVVEFFEILYLFMQLRERNKENDETSVFEVKVDKIEKHRGKNQETDQNEIEDIEHTDD